MEKPEKGHRSLGEFSVSEKQQSYMEGTRVFQCDIS